MHHDTFSRSKSPRRHGGNAVLVYRNLKRLKVPLAFFAVCVVGTLTFRAPAAIQVNAACSGSCISIGGNGAASMVLSAPNADVSLGGGGSGGYFVGAVKANNINVQGGYPVHYDVQLDRANGSVGEMVTTGYSRKKL